MINKKTYEKLNCEQMYRKIKDKMNEIIVWLSLLVLAMLWEILLLIIKKCIP